MASIETEATAAPKDTLREQLGKQWQGVKELVQGKARVGQFNDTPANAVVRWLVGGYNKTAPQRAPVKVSHDHQLTRSERRYYSTLHNYSYVQMTILLSAIAVFMIVFILVALYSRVKEYGKDPRHKSYLNKKRLRRSLGKLGVRMPPRDDFYEIDDPSAFKYSLMMDSSTSLLDGPDATKSASLLRKPKAINRSMWKKDDPNWRHYSQIPYVIEKSRNPTPTEDWRTITKPDTGKWTYKVIDCTKRKNGGKHEATVERCKSVPIFGAHYVSSGFRKDFNDPETNTFYNPASEKIGKTQLVNNKRQKSITQRFGPALEDFRNNSLLPPTSHKKPLLKKVSIDAHDTVIPSDFEPSLLRPNRPSFRKSDKILKNKSGNNSATNTLIGHSYQIINRPFYLPKYINGSDSETTIETSNSSFFSDIEANEATTQIDSFISETTSIMKSDDGENEREQECDIQTNRLSIINTNFELNIPGPIDMSCLGDKITLNNGQLNSYKMSNTNTNRDKNISFVHNRLQNDFCKNSNDITVNNNCFSCVGKVSEKKKISQISKNEDFQRTKTLSRNQFNDDLTVTKNNINSLHNFTTDIHNAGKTMLSSSNSYTRSVTTNSKVDNNPMYMLEAGQYFNRPSLGCESQLLPNLASVNNTKPPLKYNHFKYDAFLDSANSMATNPLYSATANNTAYGKPFRNTYPHQNNMQRVSKFVSKDGRFFHYAPQAT